MNILINFLILKKINPEQTGYNALNTNLCRLHHFLTSKDSLGKWVKTCTKQFQTSTSQSKWVNTQTRDANFQVKCYEQKFHEFWVLNLL